MIFFAYFNLPGHLSPSNLLYNHYLLCLFPLIPSPQIYKLFKNWHFLSTLYMYPNQPEKYLEYDRFLRNSCN